MKPILKVRDTTDEKEITSILLDEEIYDRISDDSSPNREDYVLYKKARFIGAYLDGKIIGLVIHHDRRMHMQILKPYRSKGHFLIRKAISMIDDDRIYAKIPSRYQSVIDFARLEGFKEERVIKNNYVKKGKTYDTHIMVYEK